MRLVMIDYIFHGFHGSRVCTRCGWITAETPMAVTIACALESGNPEQMQMTIERVNIKQLVEMSSAQPVQDGEIQRRLGITVHEGPEGHEVSFRDLDEARMIKPIQDAEDFESWAIELFEKQKIKEESNVR